VHAFRHGTVDEIGLLPDVGRTRSPHRTLDVDEVAGQKDSGRESGIQASSSKDRSVIEAVNAAPAVSFAEHGDDDIHCSGRFQLDVKPTPPIDQAEDLSEFRRTGPTPDLTHVQRRNQVALLAGQDRIVMNDGDAVTRQMYVEFDALDSNFEGSSERGQRVFGSFPVRSPVRDDPKRRPHVAAEMEG
jgi:hypothetical protein